MTWCEDCPLRPDGAGVRMEPPERLDRLKAYAASGVPVQCHAAPMNDAFVEAALAGGKDWRLDHPVTRPCRGTVPP